MSQVLDLGSVVGPQGEAGPNQVTTATSTDITGLLKGAGGVVAQAVAGTDYAAPADLKAKTVSGGDLNSLTEPGLYILNEGSYTNIPAGISSNAVRYLYVVKTQTNVDQIEQILYCSSDAVFTRTATFGSFGEWYQIGAFASGIAEKDSKVTEKLTYGSVGGKQFVSFPGTVYEEERTLMPDTVLLSFPIPDSGTYIGKLYGARTSDETSNSPNYMPQTYDVENVQNQLCIRPHKAYAIVGPNYMYIPAFTIYRQN